MKTVANSLLGVIALTVAAAGCTADTTTPWRPTYQDIPFPKVTASQNPDVIAAGEYLVTAVAHCTACHLPRSEVVFAEPEAVKKLVPSGGQEWNWGPMGALRSVNVTPDPAAGIGQWTDAEVARAIKYGIDRDGHPLIFMNGLGSFDDRDLQAIISYLRTLKPVNVAVPRSDFTASGKEALIKQMPGLLQPKPQIRATYVPAGKVSVERGAYLANGPAACVSCHSQVSWSPEQTIQGAAFAGSLEPVPDADNPGLEINAPNLTPSAKYGILSQWTEETFVGRIRAGRAIRSSPMAWEHFRLMSDADLASIFRYLRSLEPVDRNVGPTYRPVGWKPADAP